MPVLCYTAFTLLPHVNVDSMLIVAFCYDKPSQVLNDPHRYDAEVEHPPHHRDIIVYNEGTSLCIICVCILYVLSH